MVFRKTQTQLFAYALILCLALNCAAFSWAGSSSFGADWQPKPLVDTNALSSPKAATKPVSLPAAAPSIQAELEAKLKPAEPFIKDVESNLYLKPPVHTLLAQRLNGIQNVLFGEPKYQDAGELLAKLAELFPKEAAKANAELNRQLQSSLPPTPTQQTIQPSNAASKKRRASDKSQKPIVQTMPNYSASPAIIGTQPTPTLLKPSKKKKGLWHNDWDSSFENDPFFQDEPETSQTYHNAPQQGPSKLSAIGQGLAGLALMAGGVAGTYYMNKNNGRNNYYPNNGYYNTPYGYNGYGPNGAGAYPYGANAYPGYYGYGPQAYYGPRTYSYTPYTPYGSTYSNSTFGAISPLGVPTGFPSY